jgi:hypothetical protein
MNGQGEAHHGSSGSDVQEEVRQIQHVVLPGQTPEGEHILSVLVKRTYDIESGGSCSRAASDAKLIASDVFYDDPATSSVELESDFIPFKLATDVVLNANAYAPGGRAVPWLRVALAIGEVRKELLVVGNRTAHYQAGAPPIFTEPEPFVEMGLNYERAYGGTDIYSDPKVPCTFPRNPVGRGFAVEYKPRSVEGLELPNLEEEGDLLTPDRLCPGHFMHWERQPFPAGFGWFPKIWRPRAELAGVMPADRETEEELREVYARLVPEDQREIYKESGLPAMDFRFFNGASNGLVLPYLSGSEPVEMENLTRDGKARFGLPGQRPLVALDLGSGPVEPHVVLHTVMIRMEDCQLDLVWRGGVPYPGPDWLPQMQKMEVLIR